MTVSHDGKYDRRRAGFVAHRRDPSSSRRARAAPRRADRVLLPDARLAVRGRGRRAGDAHPRLAGLRPLRGPRGAALVALPHRDERLPRHAERQGAPRPSDGSRARAGADRGEPQHAPGGDVDRADARRARRAGGRSGRRRRRARDDPARVRRRAAAPAAAPARRADPLRGAPLAGDRGRGAARHERRLREQRAPAGARDARREQRERRRPLAAARRGRPRAARPLRRGVRGATTSTRSRR